MMFELNKSIPMFGGEHNRLQASILSVALNTNVKRLQMKERMDEDEDFGYLHLPEEDYNSIRKSNPKWVDEVWEEIEDITPLKGEKVITDMGLDVEELKKLDNFLIC